MEPASLTLMMALAGSVFGLELPSVIGENMVLQQKTEAPIWGKDQPGTEVKVTFRGQTLTIKADDQGKWMVKLPTGEPGGPFPLVIEGTKRVEFKTILVGEVWIAGGQSNIWWHTDKCQDAEKEIAAGNFPQIRLWDANTSPKQSGWQSDAPQDTVPAEWKVCSPSMLGNYPGVPYFFARKLHQELKVPVGIVHVGIPGSAIEPFFSPEYLAATGLKPFEIKGKDASTVVTPGGSWNGTVAPAVPFAARGFIWWQGEGNQSNFADYRTRFPGLVEDWRKQWHLPEAPFLFVELHGFGPYSQKPVEEATFPAIRDAQRLALKLKNTAMICVPDILETPEWQIHPPRKQMAADRLALAAMATVYGKKDVVWLGPTVKNVKFMGPQVFVTYENAGGGLEIRKKTDGGTGFALAGEDKKWFPAQAKIDGNKIIVSCEEVKRPVALRYNFVNHPSSNLCNKEGLPAAQYRTDNWELSGK